MVKELLFHGNQAEQDASTEGRDHIGIQAPLIHTLSIDNFSMSAWLRMNVGLQMKVTSATVARYYATDGHVQCTSRPHPGSKTRCNWNL
jgi:hypothetical protein